MGIEKLSERDSAQILAQQIIPGVPAAIRELVENSIDAGCTRIDIGVYTEGDRITCVVEDDGVGMEGDEVGVYSHSSKKPDGSTYGFKGTALFSLSHLSVLTVTTRREEEELSRKITFGERDGKRILRVEKCSKAERGTRVKIEGLYRNIPVREKVMRDNLSSHIREIITAMKQYVVIHNVSIRVHRGGSELFFHKRREEGVRERILSVNSIRRFRMALTLTSKVFLLQVLFGEGDKESVSVIKAGKRVLENKRVKKEISRALPQTEYVYYMEIPGDTNRSERGDKRSRSLYRENEILCVIAKIRDRTAEIRESLERGVAELQIDLDGGGRDDLSIPSGAGDLSKKPSLEETGLESSRPGPGESGPEKMSREHVSAREDGKARERGIRTHAGGDVSMEDSSLLMNREDISELVVIGQFNKGFIITKLERDGRTYFYAVDQHASDEIVTYFRLLDSFKVERQRLLAGIEITLTEIDKSLVDMNREVISRNGFVLSEDKQRILEVPTLSGESFGEREFREVLSSIREKGEKKVLFKRMREIIASKACRKSIMVGQDLTRKEMERLISDLAKTQRPWNCPHGRPTLIMIPSTIK
jgi:DNA mismatch repair protein PMS2